MPWRVTDVVEERTRFVLEYDSEEYTMAELCRIYRIARKTGYEWVERYKAEGLGGLQDRRYGAGSHPNQTEAGMEEQILQLKFAHPSWGAKKLHGHLWAKRKGVQWPVVSTFGEILRRAGLCTPQRKRLRIPVYSKPFEKVEKANQVWCADFKGWFLTGKGERIDPLTVTDAHSRYLLRCQSVAKTDTEHVEAVFTAAFREYGMPQRIRTDNGAPVCFPGHCRYLTLIGLLDEAGHPAGADQAWSSGAKRAPRAHASDVEGRDGQTAGCQPQSTTASV